MSPLAVETVAFEFANVRNVSITGAVEFFVQFPWGVNCVTIQSNKANITSVSRLIDCS